MRIYNFNIRIPAVQLSCLIGRTDGSRVFRSAARHSRFVRFLRFPIPAAILTIVAAIWGATYLKVNWSGDGDVFAITMKNPRLTGFTTDQRPYELTARAAAQDLTRPDILELQELRAKVELKDGQHVNVTSRNGVYDTKAEVLRLNDHIVITSTSGYEGRLSEATIHTSKGIIVSESPVEMKLPTGMLNANRLEVRENGAVIWFGGGVEMNLNPKQVRPAAEPAATQDTAPLAAEPTPPAAPAQAPVP
jgi:lipopolysaccharide export system protein LptC